MSGDVSAAARVIAAAALAVVKSAQLQADLAAHRDLHVFPGDAREAFLSIQADLSAAIEKELGQ